MSKNLFVTRATSILLGILVLTSISVTALPQKADAQFGGIVFDPTNLVQNTASAIANVSTNLKGYTLDPLAWMLAKTALQAVVKSTVNSVNSGPNGTPQFVTNLNSLLLSVGDTAANGFIQQLSSNGSIQSPFQTAVATAVGNNYLQSTGSNSYFNQNPFTLNQVSSNPTAFYNGDITNSGGLNAWMSAWENPQNNPFGAAQLASNALGAQVSNAQSVQKSELSYGQGFLSSRGKCTTTTTGGSTQSTSVASLVTSLSANSTCQSQSIQTPGSTIKASLDKALGSGIDTLVNAHTLDEIVSSVLTQMLNQVLGGSGLTGASQPSSTTGGTTYFAQTDPSQTAANAALSSSFSSTITTQITQLQQFQTNWTTINNAALAAQTALNKATCEPSAQSTLTSTVQPVLTQAATELAQASAAITALQNIQNQANSAVTTTDISNATTAYTNLITPPDGSASILPSATDISYAATQSIDTSGASSATPTSLLTQMNEIAASASCLRNGLGN